MIKEKADFAQIKQSLNDGEGNFNIPLIGDVIKHLVKESDLLANQKEKYLAIDVSKRKQAITQFKDFFKKLDGINRCLLEWYILHGVILKEKYGYTSEELSKVMGMALYDAGGDLDKISQAQEKAAFLIENYNSIFIEKPDVDE